MQQVDFTKEMSRKQFIEVLELYSEIYYIKNEVDRKKVEIKSPSKEFNSNRPIQDINNEIEKLIDINLSDLIYKNIINDLLRQALLNGIHDGHEIKTSLTPASEGSTAGNVSITSTDVKFVTKIDNSEKLIREAMILKIIEDRTDIPSGFSSYFPKVYAVKRDAPPYAYIMEAFNRKSFSKLLYDDKIDFDTAKKIINYTLKILFSAYTSSVNFIVSPNIAGIYLNRIKERIQLAIELDNEFKYMTESEININGVNYAPLEKYINIIESNIDRFQLPFATFVHGDSHPENILVKLDNDIDIKFIDPKDWYEGDYMFDIGKLCHYLLVAGPVEKAENKPTATIDIWKKTIIYNLTPQDGTDDLITIVKDRVRDFSINNGDKNWENRYTLSIASNLLGIPAGRIKKGDYNSAYIMYAEGLKYLSYCIQ